MSMKPTVWVIQSSDKNIDPARKFGDIEVMILQNGHSPGEEATCMHYITQTISREMKDGDFLLPIGNPLYFGVALHAALMVHPRVKVLLWDRKTADYRIQTVDA